VIAIVQYGQLQRPTARWCFYLRMQPRPLLISL